mgnify:CR=1 FL=1
MAWNNCLLWKKLGYDHTLTGLSQFQYQNCNNCERVLWCAAVFCQCHSLIARSEARIVENWIKTSWFCTKLIIERQHFLSKKLWHLWLMLRQWWLIRIATLVVGVAAFVVFFWQSCFWKDWAWCCNNCGWLQQFWTLWQLWTLWHKVHQKKSP